VAPRPSPVALPARLAVVPTAGVVGRDAEIAAIEASVATALSGGGHRLCLVTGDAGIGKSTLVADVARRASTAGAVVLLGRCVEDLGIPYLPFIEALRGLIETGSEQLLDALPGNDLIELGRLVDAVGPRWPDLPHPASTDADTEQYVLFGAIVRSLTAVSRTHPVFLVIEDIHWADASTLQLVRHLSSVLGEARVFVLATGRSDDPSTTPAIADGLADLRRSSGVDHVLLEGFDDAQMVSLLEHLAGHAMDSDGVALARDLCVETKGNPFFATAILEHLAETGVIAPIAGRWAATVSVASIELPDTVRDVIERRLRFLDDEVRSVLSYASVLGREFDLAPLAALLETDEDAVLGHLERACAAGLLVEDDERLERFGFDHALIQQALYEGQSRTRRARRHRQIADLLEHDSGPSTGPGRAAELAHHWAATGTPEGAGRAAVHACRAGALALESLAPRDALAWFQRAIELDRRSAMPRPELRLDARIGLGEAQRQSGDPAFRETLIGAALEADLAGDVERMVRAVLANHRGLVSTVGEVDDERVTLIERAVAAVGLADSDARARLLSLLAAELTFGRDHARVRAAATEAEAIARRLGNEETLLRVLNLVFLAMWVPSEHERTQRVTEEAMRLADRCGDPVQRFLAATNRHYAMISSVDRVGIDQALAVANSLAEEVGQPFLVWRIGFAACMPPLLDGDVERAEAMAEAALDVGVQSGQPDSFALYGANLVQIRLHQGRGEEILPLIAELARENSGLPAFTGAHAMMLAECGHLDEARALLDEAMAADFHHDAYDYVWLTATTLWADAAAATGHVDAARVLYDRLEPFESQGVASGPTLSGTVGMYLARLAVVLGRDDAGALFERADHQLDQLGARYFQARNRLHWAEHLLSAGDAVSVERVTALLAEARSTGERLGCPAVVERADLLLGSSQ
jgi:hypothetical protein